jgi:maltodextrin utilization protein YvdJ
MSKIKQYIENSVENAVDKIISKLSDGQIDLDTCKSKILELDNLEMVGITEDNVEEVIAQEKQ